MSHPARGLELLYRRAGGTPWVTLTYLAACTAVTASALFVPEVRDHLSGVAPRSHWWQPISAAFLHGWPGFNGAVHLALNAFLFVEAGVPCERLLGTRRFLLLSALALAASAAVISVTDGVNGASVVIWAWGPALFVAWRQTERLGGPAAERIRVILVVMYVLVTLGMGALPYLFGFRGSPLRAFLMGNTFHAIATGVGIAGAVAFRGRIRRWLTAPGPVKL